jgi:hypothetical protein
MRIHDVSNMILLARRDPAGGYNQVVLRRCRDQRFGKLAGLVGQDAAVRNNGTSARQHARQHEAVGIVDLSRRQGGSWLAQLVAGREQPGRQAPPDGQ